MVSAKFMNLLTEMEDIHKRNNAGYAGEDSMDPWANFRMSEAIGVSAFNGCLVRMGDKYTRVCNLAKNPDNEQVGESIHDTLIDLANYALIAICLYEEENALDKTGILNEKMSLTFHYSLMGKHARICDGPMKSGVGVVINEMSDRVVIQLDDGVKLSSGYDNIEVLD